MTNSTKIHRYFLHISTICLMIVMSGFYSCTSLSSDDKAVQYYTFKELGEMEYLPVLEEQLCALKPGTAAYCKKLIQYKINKCLQTYILDTTLLEEIEAEVNKQPNAKAYDPVVMYLKSYNIYKTDVIAAYELAVKARELFEKYQDTEGIIRINFVIININFIWTTNEYLTDLLTVDSLMNQNFELTQLSNYPIHRINYLTLFMIKLRDHYSGAALVHKVDSIICEAQNFVHQNPKVEYLLPTIYNNANVVTYLIDKRLIVNDYALMALQARIDPNRYVTYANYANKFETSYITDSIIKYVKLSIDSNNGIDLFFLARQYKSLAGIYEDLGNYPLALDYLYTYDSLSQIINKNIRQKGIIEVQSKYDFQKIQTEQEQLIQEKRNVTIAMLLISIILILISILLIYIKKLNDKQKAWIKQKENIISVISHDLKSPLLAMTESSKFVFEAIEKNDLHSVKHFYTSFNIKMSYMYGFTNNLLDWLTDKDAHKTKETVTVLIHELQKSIHSYAQFKHVQVSFCDVLLDQTYEKINVAKGVEVIIRNIVTNIINHTDASHIEICSKMADTHMYISITDYASPMDDDTYDFVTARLQSSQTHHLFASQGFGLTLVRRFMESTNTSVEVKRLENGNVYVLKVVMD